MKTRRIKIILTIILLSPIVLFAQKKELVHWFDNTIETKYGKIISFHEEDNVLKIVQHKKKEIKIITVDPITEKSTEQIFDLHYPSRKTHFSKVIEINKKKYAIFNEIDKRKKKFRVYSLPLDKNNSGELTLIYEHAFVRNGQRDELSRPKRRADIETTFIESEDRTKIAFINQSTLNERRKNEKIQIAVFDSTFTLIWDKAIEFPYRDRDLQIGEFIVSNDGKDIFLLAALSKSAGRYSLYHITKDAMNKTKLKIKNNRYPITIIPMFGKDNKTLSLIGIYQDKNNKRKKNISSLLAPTSYEISGVFWGSTDLENIQSPNFQYHEFTKEEREKIKGTSFQLADIHFFNNGNIHILFTGRYSYYLNTSNSKKNPYYEIRYAYTELISCIFNHDREFVNNNIIERKHILDFNGKGHTAIYDNNSVFLIFISSINENQAKRLKTNTKRLTLHSIIELIQIDDSGIEKGEYLLWNSKNRPFPGFFISPLAAKSGEKLFFGGKIQKGAKGFFSGMIELSYGYLNLKDFKD